MFWEPNILTFTQTKLSVSAVPPPPLNFSMLFFMFLSENYTQSASAFNYKQLQINEALHFGEQLTFLTFTHPVTKISALYAEILCIYLGLDAELGWSLGSIRFPGGRN